MNTTPTPSDAREELRKQARLIVATATHMVNLEAGNMTFSEADKIHDKAADDLAALFDTLLAKKVREALQSILESETLQFPSQAAARAVIEAHLKGASK